ncbi:TonB-dependent receptor plug domain-containing protein [Belliella baltica]|uniref:TonB-dependent receptor plug domain-containing protein n=1 Tax=Belliella baltica TaxID=232259 RepID=UPI0002F37AEC
MKKQLLLVILLLLTNYAEVFSQQQKVEGFVKSNQDFLPIYGASISIKGTTRGVISDLDGRYSIQADASETLVFSFVGFVSKEFIVGKNSNIEVILETIDKEIEVQVGYDSQMKGDLTGNIASVKGADLATIPVPNFQEALHGRMAGVFVESSSGKLGEGVKIRVRGTTSISGGNDPLYVIDGLPMTSSGGIGLYNPLSDINFNDVESFEVLKDASAAAIYGARAANGVVLITTKSGTKGKTKFNVGIQRGVSSPT